MYFYKELQSGKEKNGLPMLAVPNIISRGFSKGCARAYHSSWSLCICHWRRDVSSTQLDLVCGATPGDAYLKKKKKKWDVENGLWFAGVPPVPPSFTTPTAKNGVKN